MFDGEEDFKFYVYDDQVFHLEKVLLDNNIEFHNELSISNNFRTEKYYIRISDLKRFDKACKETKIDIFTYNQPRIHRPIAKLKFKSIFIFILTLIFMILLFIML